jgi:hypothetical protein
MIGCLVMFDQLFFTVIFNRLSQQPRNTSTNNNSSSSQKITPGKRSLPANPQPWRPQMS